jgi:cytoskeletal protein CcmA (bactofilin family)
MKALNDLSGDSEGSEDSESGSPAERPANPYSSQIPPRVTPPTGPVARTVITKDTKITGSITTSSALDIAGTIVGDIFCEADMRVTGRIEGNVTAESIEMSGSRIKGDVSVKGTAYVRQGSVTVGNLSASEAEVNGNIKGDLNIANAVQILNDAHVIGDVHANVLEITRGAAVQGRLIIKSSENRPDPFSEF